MRARHLLFALSALGAWGCSSDPCAGQAGPCISARVVGAATGLDQLAITVDKPLLETVHTPSSPSPFTLPVSVGLALRAGAGGVVSVSVDGLGHGHTLAHAALPVTLSAAGRAAVTITLDAGSAVAPDLRAAPADAGSDGGDDLASPPDLVVYAPPDMSCPGVFKCQSGDGCCPTGCTQANDRDCLPATCGNGVLESGEVCDDGNTANGDGCDPTCHYRNQLDAVAGFFDLSGFYDGPGTVARFARPLGPMGYSSTTLYIMDVGNRALRAADLATGNVTTLFGFTAADPNPALGGSFKMATIHLPGDVIYLGGSVYYSDGSKLRQANLSQQTVSDFLDLGSATAYADDGLSVDSANNLILLAEGSGISTLAPPSTAKTSLVTLTALSAVTSGYCVRGVAWKDQQVPAHQHYTFACDYSIIDLDNGTPSLLAGSKSTSGCVDGPLTASTFTQAHSIARTSFGAFVIWDRGCAAVRQIDFSGTFANKVHTIAGCSMGAGTCRPAPTEPPLQSDLAFTDNIVAIPDATNTTYITAGGGVATIPVNGNNNVTSFVGSWGLGGGNTSAIYNGTTQLTYFNDLRAIASDGKNAYVSGFDAILTTVAMGSGMGTYLGASGGAGSGMTRLGNTLYVSSNDGTIYRIGTDGSGGAIYAGVTRAQGTSATPSDGPRLSAVMTPKAIVSDGTNLFFIDSNTLRMIDATGKVSTIAGLAGSTDILNGTGTGAHFAAATGLAFDGSAFYTLDGTGATRTMVRRISWPGLVVDFVAGDAATSGHADGSGAMARFGAATDIVSDGDALFVLDDGIAVGAPLVNGTGPTVREIVPATQSVTTMLGQVGAVTFRPATGTAALVAGPRTVTFDATLHALIFFDASDLLLRVR